MGLEPTQTQLSSGLLLDAGWTSSQSYIVLFQLSNYLLARGQFMSLQSAGLDVDKNAIQRIEAGKRFVTDIELTFFPKVPNASIEMLLNDSTTKE